MRLRSLQNRFNQKRADFTPYCDEQGFWFRARAGGRQRTLLSLEAPGGVVVVIDHKAPTWLGRVATDINSPRPHRAILRVGQ